MSARIPPGDYDEEGEPVWTPNIHGNSGAAHYVSADTDFAKRENRVQKFREVVAEVTNGRIPAPPPRRGPGFL